MKQQVRGGHMWQVKKNVLQAKASERVPQLLILSDLILNAKFVSLRNDRDNAACPSEYICLSSNFDIKIFFPSCSV